MSVLNIDHLLFNLPKNRIRLVGIELEGGWTKFPEDPEERINFHGDGTVKFPPPHSMKTGEIVSPPIEPAAMGKWVKRFYPQKVNETCGLHIHMSFHQIRHYKRLMVQEYQDTMLEYLTRWARSQKFSEERPCDICGFMMASFACQRCL